MIETMIRIFILSKTPEHQRKSKPKQILISPKIYSCTLIIQAMWSQLSFYRLFFLECNSAGKTTTLTMPGMTKIWSSELKNSFKISLMQNSHSWITIWNGFFYFSYLHFKIIVKQFSGLVLLTRIRLFIRFVQQCTVHL